MFVSSSYTLLQSMYGVPDLTCIHPNGLFRRTKDDEMLKDDHSLNLDDQDVRETKKARATVQRSTKESGNTSTGGEGARTGARVNGVGQGGGIGRQLSVTKQEALRSKGLFKIAPQSKVNVEDFPAFFPGDGFGFGLGFGFGFGGGAGSDSDDKFHLPFRGVEWCTHEVFFRC